MDGVIEVHKYFTFIKEKWDCAWKLHVKHVTKNTCWFIYSFFTGCNMLPPWTGIQATIVTIAVNSFIFEIMTWTRQRDHTDKQRLQVDSAIACSCNATYIANTFRAAVELSLTVIKLHAMPVSLRQPDVQRSEGL